MKNIAVGLIIAVVATVGLLFILNVTAPDPKFNPATFEDTALESNILEFDQGWTLAQTLDSQGYTKTLLVVDYDSASVTAVDLTAAGAPPSDNPFSVLDSLNDQELRALVLNADLHQVFSFDDLASIAGDGEQHIGIGTNFPEHAEEAQSDSVFNFPKFGQATPARTSVAWLEGGLLDYEIELCARFDRPIRSLADFDAAAKGFFLCGDFTQRGRLLRLINVDDLDSGAGFSDGKSGVGFFPTGALLVVPHDWRSFIADQRMTTSVNGEPRQDARGGEMIYDFRELTDKVLADMDEPRFLYQEGYVKLAPSGQIEQDMILMSGTSEGVIFTAPTRADLINAALVYLKNGAIFGEMSLYDTAIESFIAAEHESGHFLQIDDQVKYDSSSMGNIVIEVQ